MEKTLQTGKKIEMKELSALEEVLAFQLLGKGYDDKNVVGTAALHRSILTLLSIDKVNGVEQMPPKDLPEAFKMLKTFPKKEWAEIGAMYLEMNEVDLGE